MTHFSDHLFLLSGKVLQVYLKRLKIRFGTASTRMTRASWTKCTLPTGAPGIAVELVLATLNTNLHVYAVSPALTLLEKEVTRALASLFGLNGEDSGGISFQGGAVSNLSESKSLATACAVLANFHARTPLLIARIRMFPATWSQRMGSLSRPLTLFTSTEPHCSISSAALLLYKLYRLTREERRILRH